MQKEIYLGTGDSNLVNAWKKKIKLFCKDDVSIIPFSTLSELEGRVAHSRKNRLYILDQTVSIYDKNLLVHLPEFDGMKFIENCFAKYPHQFNSMKFALLLNDYFGAVPRIDQVKITKDTDLRMEIYKRMHEEICKESTHLGNIRIYPRDITKGWHYHEGAVVFKLACPQLMRD